MLLWKKINKCFNVLYNAWNSVGACEMNSVHPENKTKQKDVGLEKGFTYRSNHFSRSTLESIWRKREDCQVIFLPQLLELWWKSQSLWTEKKKFVIKKIPSDKNRVLSKCPVSCQQGRLGTAQRKEVSRWGRVEASKERSKELLGARGVGGDRQKRWEKPAQRTLRNTQRERQRESQYWENSSCWWLDIISEQLLIFSFHHDVLVPCRHS